MKPGDAFFLVAVLTTAFFLSIESEVRSQTQTFTLLHTFTAASGATLSNSDGANPSAGLILSGDKLFGTAKYGGSFGAGTFFALDLSGAGISIPHHFTGGEDGSNPTADLALSGSVLYGSASAGGSFNAGTAYGVKSDGTAFQTLHSFTKPVNDTFGFHTNSDGAYPMAGLLLSGNNLYGAANDGGSSGRGTLFAITTNGTGFASLHSFSSGSGGAYSSSPLILVNNVLYGANYANLGNGTVFAVNPDGSDFTNYYAFTPGALNNFGVLTNSDGANPRGKLLLSGNTLYGTTENGGAYGNGVVFAINWDGSGFVNLHSFAAGAYNHLGFYTNSDGTHPSAGLILSGTNLYGTASAGGISGQGTVFMLSTNGAAFLNLYNFSATPRYPIAQTNSDGANPAGGLVVSSNSLYGTTAYGGHQGNGTAFRLSFAPHLAISLSATNVILTWPGNGAGFDFSQFVLQSAATSTGVFSSVIGATSPYTNPIAVSQKFYRLTQ